MKNIASLIFILSVLSNHSAYGQTTDSQQAFDVSLGLRQIAWEESDENGNILVEEDGAIPQLNLSYTTSSPQWLFSLEANYATGSIDYDGQTQLGAPFITDTDIDIFDIRYTGAYTFNLASIRPQLFGAIGYYQRDRLINNNTLGVNPGRDEKYTWAYGAIGIRSSVFKHQLTAFNISLEYGIGFNDSVESRVLNQDNTENIELNDTVFYQLALTNTTPIHKRFKVVSELSFNVITLDDSVADRFDTLRPRQPDTIEETFNINVGIRYVL